MFYVCILGTCNDVNVQSIIRVNSQGTTHAPLWLSISSISWRACNNAFVQYMNWPSRRTQWRKLSPFSKDRSTGQTKYKSKSVEMELSHYRVQNYYSLMGFFDSDEPEGGVDRSSNPTRWEWEMKCIIIKSNIMCMLRQELRET